MTEQTSQTQAATTNPPARAALRDRVLGWRGVAGVALASVILGGAGGAVLGAVSNGGDSRGPGNLGGPGGFGGPGRMMQNSRGQQPDGVPGNQGQPPTGLPGQLPPSTPPQQDQQDSQGSGSNT
jgi:hypothetical protein